MQGTRPREAAGWGRGGGHTVSAFCRSRRAWSRSARRRASFASAASRESASAEFNFLTTACSTLSLLAVSASVCVDSWADGERRGQPRWQ